MVSDTYSNQMMVHCQSTSKWLLAPALEWWVLGNFSKLTLSAYWMIKILFQCQIVITTPMELLKIALQDSGRVAASASLNTQAPAGAGATGATQAPPVKVKAPTATEIAMKVFKQKGFLGFYQGGTATLVRDVFFSAIYFPLFAYFNSMVRKYLPVFFDSFLTLKTLCF